MKLALDMALNKHINKFIHTVEPKDDGITGHITTVESEQEKAFIDKLMQNDLFQEMNVFFTKHAQGEAFGLVEIMAGTTDTNRDERVPKKAHNDLSYFCQQINLDSYIRYDKLDSFNAEGNFIEVFENYFQKHLLNNALLVGFNGVGRNGTSDPEVFPLAQDVQKGFLQKIRENAQTTGKNNVMDVGKVGESGQYKTLHKLIKEALTRIEPIYSGYGLVAICGREIIGDNLIAQEDSKHPKFITRLQKTLGGVPVVSLPYFPENAILLTRLENLSLYVHRHNIRRGFLNQPGKDYLAHYFSWCVDFVVENYNACALLENIKLEE
ncbi:P2 family phage major capsid protein [Actinobacillus lignieresii]|uniref:Phage major capsid protein, P2 family n=1 Tax=Actinobacillus lignieresii TaxID=720 RepID=A0A380TXD2_ACTLI|nr:P2 family phage major capsid protein [Actinobacillus lignieresii]SUT92711.1 phage major capsid protein, P2 family [Actinobacillus lignieresii]